MVAEEQNVTVPPRVIYAKIPLKEFGEPSVQALQEAVQWIEERGDEITEVSLDHDLCQAHYTGDYSDCETGFDVLALLLERGLRPVIHLHTMNAEGVQRMQDLLDSL